MSQAEDLLNSLSSEEIEKYGRNSDNEGHIVIGIDRNISVPKPLRRIAVQYDNNVETVTFDCPRYWDDTDLSTLYIYVNYMTPNRGRGRCLVKNVRVDDEDENMIHFEWTIGKEVTLVNGKIHFLVYAVQTDSEGNDELHWNSELNDEMHVSEGMECEDVIPMQYPDIINDLLTRMDTIIAADAPYLDTSLSQNGLAADAGVTGAAINKKANYCINVAEMIEESSLKAGDTIITLGYYNANDGGGATYLIRSKESNDVEDSGSIYFLDNGLVAELVIKDKTITPNMFGCKGDGVTDDTERLQYCIDYAIANKVNINVIGKYLVNPKDMDDNTKVCLTVHKDSSNNSHVYEIETEIYFKRGASILTLSEEECTLMRFNISNLSIVNPNLKGILSKTTLIEFSKINQLDKNESQWTCHNVIRNPKLQNAKRCIAMQGSTYYNTFDKVYIRDADYGIILEQTLLEKNGVQNDSNVNRNEFNNVVMNNVLQGGVRIEYGDTNKFVNLSFEGVANPIYLDCPKKHTNDFAITPKYFTNDNMFVNVTMESFSGPSFYNNADGTKIINTSVKFKQSNFVVAPLVFIGGIDGAYSPEKVLGIYKSLEDLAIEGANKYSHVVEGAGGIASKAFYDYSGTYSTGVTPMSLQNFKFDTETSTNVESCTYESVSRVLAKSMGGIIFVNGKVKVSVTNKTSNIILKYPETVSWLDPHDQLYEFGVMTYMTIPIAVQIEGVRKLTMAILTKDAIEIVVPDGGWVASGTNVIFLNYQMYRNGIVY